MTLNVPSRVTTSGRKIAPVVLVQATPQKSPNAATVPDKKGGRKMGDWLQSHKDLPLDQQLKLLENDPASRNCLPTGKPHCANA